MIMRMIYGAILITIFTACDANAPAASQAEKTNKAGSDRDAHGCIASAGYSWCEKTKLCERPWELAKKQKFEKTSETFDNYCGNKK
ncbi:MAG: peptidase [Campylobacterota bacterium]|nr:peptidase [Campylobacterota bacterium]